jgi:hemolysin activation/secretion protein
MSPFSRWVCSPRFVFLAGGLLLGFVSAIQAEGSPQDAYPVTRFVFEYVSPEDGRGAEESLPVPAELAGLQVRLHKNGARYSAPTPGVPTELVPLSGGGSARLFDLSALVSVGRTVVSELNRRGTYGVLAVVDPAQINVEVSPPEDLRTSPSELRFLVYYSRIETLEIKRQNHAPPRHWLYPPATVGERIVSHSPLQPGHLLQKDVLQNYLSGVNRLEGRHVETIVGAGSKSGTVRLALSLSEEKRFSALVLSSNSGTKETGEWRTQIGAQIRQVAGLDDLLSVDYITSDFSRYRTLSVSEEVALVFPDILKARLYASWSDLSLADLGQTGLGFRSRSETVGLQTSWRPELFTATPLTFTAGAYGTTSTVHNESIAREGSSTFFVPYLGVDAERRSQRGRWTASLQVERVGTADEDLSILGRPEPSRKAWVSHWSTTASRRSGSLKEMLATEGTASASTHEASLALHGQYIASPDRVTPQFQGVAGGVNTVRGYPESLSAGDTVSLASMQYRVRLNSLFHTANTGRHPTEEAAPDPSGELGSSTHAATPQADREAMRAVDPSTLIPRSGGAPLEVSLRGFLDAAQVRTNQAKSGFGEVANRTLLGVGGGLDLVFRGQFKGLIRADLGFALNGQHQPGNTQVDAGSSRVHVTVMLNW